MTAPRLAAITATAALALPAAALAQDGRFSADPWAVETSNGAYVDYDLSASPKRQTVTVDGKRAVVKEITEDGNRFYRAFVVRPSLDDGDRVKLTVKVTRRNGKRFTLQVRRLEIHATRDRRPAA